MTVEVGDVLRCTARFRHPVIGDVVNVFDFVAGGSGTASNTQAMNAINTYISSVYAEFDDLMHQDTVCYDLKVDIIAWDGEKWVVTENIGQQTWGATLTFASTTDLLPTAASALGKLFTSLGKHVGKKFFGLMTEGSNGGSSTVLSTAQVKILAGLTNLLTPGVMATTMTLISSVIDTKSFNVRLVLEVAVNEIWAYHRSRKAGVGS